MCMKKQTLVRDATVMLLALFAAYAMVMLTQAVMGRIEGRSNAYLYAGGIRHLYVYRRLCVGRGGFAHQHACWL